MPTVGRSWYRTAPSKIFHAAADDWIRSGLAVCGRSIRNPGYVSDGPPNRCADCKRKLLRSALVEWSEAAGWEVVRDVIEWNDRNANVRFDESTGEPYGPEEVMETWRYAIVEGGDTGESIEFAHMLCHDYRVPISDALRRRALDLFRLCAFHGCTLPARPEWNDDMCRKHRAEAERHRANYQGPGPIASDGSVAVRSEED